jgi:hypothetical protein
MIGPLPPSGRLRNDLEIGALARRGGDAGAETFQAAEGRVLGGRLALLHHMKDLIDEPVETEKALELEQLGARTDEAFRCLTGKAGIRDHPIFLTEKDWRDKLRSLTW